MDLYGTYQTLCCKKYYVEKSNSILSNRNRRVAVSKPFLGETVRLGETEKEVHEKENKKENNFFA